jgi:hypothetical protein
MVCELSHFNLNHRENSVELSRIRSLIQREKSQELIPF